MPERETYIDTNHRGLIENAVQSIFPSSSWAIEGQLAGGLSTSTLYKLIIDDKRYVARLSDPEHLHNNLEREYGAMQIGADQALGPALHYAHAETGLAIMDFIESQPSRTDNESDFSFIVHMARLLRNLHHGQPFQKDISLVDKVEFIVSQLRPEFASAKLVQNGVATMRSLAPLLQNRDDERPCHCDINPGNVLFDGARLWLVDWASATQENFYFDLACCCSFYFPAHSSNKRNEAEQAFLQHYFERPLTEEEKEKYARMSTFAAIFYGVMFVYLSSAQGTQILADTELESLPDYSQFMESLSEGKEDLSNPLSQQRLGFIYLKKLRK